MFELRSTYETRLLVLKHNDIIEVILVFDKKNQKAVFAELEALNILTLEEIKSLTKDE